MLKPPAAFPARRSARLDRRRHRYAPDLVAGVDLYLQTTRIPEDERYYAKNALRLIDATISPRARRRGAAGAYPAAPRAVIARLARDLLEVAEPILAQSPCLLPADQGHRRGAGQPAAIIATLRQYALPSSTQTLATRANAPQNRRRSSCAAFFAAGGRAPFDPVEPRLLLDRPRSRPRRCSHGRAWVNGATQFGSGGAHRTRPRRVAQSRTRGIVQDELGEPVVIAAGHEPPADVLQRMLLSIRGSGGQ